MDRKAPRALAVIRERVDPVLQGYVDGLHPPLRRIARFHFGWDDAAGAGKAVRPALAVLGARAAGAAGDEPEVVDAACAVELIHNFSLLHDDIMDGDRTRRHRPTAWTVFGANQALLAGCALHTLAFEILARRGSALAVDSLAQCVQVLIAGQSDDLALAGTEGAAGMGTGGIGAGGNGEDGYPSDAASAAAIPLPAPEVTLEQCLAMESGKTASLLSAAASLGALTYGAPRESCELLAEYGHHLGMAFQMVDDLLGIWGDPARTGKPVAADLRARKRSAPVVAALTSGTREGDRLAVLLATPGELSEEDVALAAKLVEESGGRSWTSERADLHTREALARLDRLAPDPTAFEDLAQLSRFLLQREW